MNWPIESAIKALNEHKKADSYPDFAVAADSLASVVDEFLRCAAQRDPDIAEEVDEYFNRPDGLVIDEDTITFQREDLKVVWEQLGEGRFGDYDPDNPEDQKLLRVTVYKMDELDGKYHMLDSASYCTNFPVSASTKEKIVAIELIMSEFYKTITSGYSIKKTCEQLSWIDPSWVDVNSKTWTEQCPFKEVK